MNAFGFAWRSLLRQPARATLGMLGVAAVGALLFDMLMLSQGLVVSMRDLLDKSGFDIRVAASANPPGSGPRIGDASATADAIAGLPSVQSAIAIRLARAELRLPDAGWIGAGFQGVSGAKSRPWTMLRGKDADAAGDVIVNEVVARLLQSDAGSTLTLQALCSRGASEILPTVSLRVTGVAEFPFESPGDRTIAAVLKTMDAACGGNSADEADFILVTSVEDTNAAAAAIRALRPDLYPMTNEQMLGRFQENEFTYFRQISTVLTSVTVSFALLLITVLLTVSVNQRIGEIAALRALGFSRRRVVADVLCESVLIVGMGGILSLPLGALLAARLDRILKGIPEIPEAMHFFVFQREALGVHLLLLTVTAFLAALYPMRIVARLPIAATLRDEIIS